jgi:thiol-disulfide isomerase/thioredoxin
VSEFKNSPRAVPFLALVAAALIAGGALAYGQAGTAGSGAPVLENMPRSWYRNFDYGVEVDGALSDGAGLYQMVGKRLMLIFGPSLSEGDVLAFEPRVVRPVGSAEITAKNDLEVVLAEAAFAKADPIPWMADGSTAVIFYADQKKYRIARVQPIVGETTAEEVFKHNPMYRRGMEEYSPDDEAVATLRRIGSKALIEVWFGTWCPHCQKVVPRFLKTLRAAGNPNLEAQLHAVPRRFTDYEPAAQRDIRGVPTLVFLRSGKEFGRIRGGGEEEPLETEVARILTSSTAPAGR